MRKSTLNPPSAPTSVADSWARIEDWLGKHLPLVKASLRRGVSHADLAAFEEAVGRPLPEDVRESYLIHDGRSPISKAVPENRPSSQATLVVQRR